MYHVRQFKFMASSYKFILKGKALVAQSGGCTAVINQSLAGIVEAARGAKAITHILGAENGITGVFSETFINLKSKPASLIRAIANTPSAALGSARHKLAKDEEYRVIEILKKSNIRYFFLIGGNDTADTIHRVAEAAAKQNYELRCIHVPKTIDNDLMETDHCPGYGSVARFAAITTQEAGLDTRSMRRVDPVKIIELMGRNSGWIVAASALLKKKESDPPHILLFPEVPFDEKSFLSKVSRSLSRHGYCVAVISETIRDDQGNRIGARKSGITHDAFGHQYVEGAANYLARITEAYLKVRARFDKPGTIQRMSIPYVSPVDQKEARQAGAEAVRWALKGLSGVMVAFERGKGAKYAISYKPVPVEKIANRERYLPASFLTPEKTAVTPDFIHYALPLLGGNLPAHPSLV